MVLEGGMQPLRFWDVEDVDRNIPQEVEKERKKMLVLVSMGEWDSVFKRLSQDCPTTSIFRLLPMNSSKDTLMHLAASEGQTEVVRKLLELTKENDMGAGAPLANVTGNTPLHLAAAHGHEEICRCIIEEAPEMAAARNVDGETPIFVAALSESKKAFSTLCSMVTDAGDIALLRRNDGDTILHCAVSGECFGFSRRITKMRKKKQKHIWAKKVMHQLLEHIEHWWDFGEINTGMDPYRFRLEGSRGRNPGLALPVGEIPIALQLEKEIASASEINSIQERQRFPTTTSLLSDPSSSSIPRTDSNMLSSAIGASSNLSKEELKGGLIESPFLTAGRKGVKEMVEAILNNFPMAIHDIDLEQKNIIMLAAEHRQPDIYTIFLKRKTESWFGKVDAGGNTVLHLAAKHSDNQPLLIPGAALQMQREIKWFKFVEEHMPRRFSKRKNHKGETAMEVFTKTHKELAQERGKWLNNVLQSCSALATLITTVAFATIASRPGGPHDLGHPVFQGELAFNVFSVSSLIALCFSSICAVMFLSIVTSPYQDLNYSFNLPKKLVYGLASLFISIAAMFLSFFTGNLFVLDSKIKYMAYPIIILTLGVVLPGFGLCCEFVKEKFTKYPSRTYPQKLSI